MEIDEWHPPTQPRMPATPQAFPPTGVNALASLGARGVARTIDTLLLGLPYALVAWAVLAAVDEGGADSAQLSIQARLALVAPVALLLTLYETVMVTLWGQTLGKMIVGIRVARQVNGRCPLWWESGLRIGLVAVVLAIPHDLAVAVAMGLFTTAGFDPLRRNITDRAAGTVVVRAR